jgi:hypothetical protein
LVAVPSTIWFGAVVTAPAPTAVEPAKADASAVARLSA